MCSQEGLEIRNEIEGIGLRKGRKPAASGHVQAQQPEDTEQRTKEASKGSWHLKAELGTHS